MRKLIFVILLFALSVSFADVTITNITYPSYLDADSSGVIRANVSSSVGVSNVYLTKGWSRQTNVTINASELSSDIQNALVKITLTPENFDYGQCKPDGSDIRFKNESGDLLEYTFEHWSYGGISTIVLRLPLIQAHSTQIIYMIYGSSAATRNTTKLVDVDVAAAVSIGDRFAWYRNNGSESFTEYNISTVRDGPESVQAIDLDGDGDIDIVANSFSDDTVVWYENDGSESFTEHIINSSSYGAQDIYSIDLDGDGDIDVVSTARLDNALLWYENNGSESFTEHIINTTIQSPYGVYAIDLDQDGDIDILTASAVDNTIAWYENDGSESFTFHNISSSASGARAVYAIDVDQDGDIDVLSASFNNGKIAWYENDGSESFTEHIVTTSAAGAYSVYAIDLDTDRDIDILATSSSNNQVLWYENNGSESFTEHIVGTNVGYAYDVYATDLDQDGDIDVVASANSGDRIIWYENNGSESFTEYNVTNTTDGPHGIHVAAIDENFVPDTVKVEVGQSQMNGDPMALESGDSNSGIYNYTLENEQPREFCFTIQANDTNDEWNSSEEKCFWIQNITMTINTNATDVDVNETVNVSGVVKLLPNNTGYNPTLDIYVNDELKDQITPDNNGFYNYTINFTVGGYHTILINTTDSNGIDGTNMTTIRVKEIVSNLISPTTVYKGQTISLNSSVRANIELNNVWLNYSLPNGFEIQDQNNYVGNMIVGQVSWNNATILINGSTAVGEYTVTVNASNQTYYNATSKTLTVYGYASISIVSPGDVVNRSSGTIDIVCKVFDNMSDEGIENYPVTISWDDTNYNVLTNSTGYAKATVDISNEDIGTHTVKCNISDNVSLYYYTDVSNDTKQVTEYGTIYIDLSLNPDTIYKNDSYEPYNTTITAHVYDDKGNNLTGVNVIFKVDNQVVDNALTNENGIATTVYNPPESMSIGEHTVRAEATKINYYEGTNETTLVIQGHLIVTLVNPSNGVILNRGNTYFFNSTCVDDSGTAYPIGKWYLNDTNIGNSQNITHTISNTQDLGVYTLKVNATKEYATPDEDSITVNIWGWASLVNMTPNDAHIAKGSTINITCKVQDENSNPINSYSVEFYKNNSLMYTAQTNSSGWATWTWDTSSDEGVFNISCKIQDQEPYNASTSLTSTIMRVEKVLYITQIDVEHSTVYRSDAYDPHTTNITVTVKQPSESGNLIASENANISLTLPDQDASCTTNSSGQCTITYNPNQSVIPNDYVINVTAEKPDFNSTTAQFNLEIRGVLTGFISNPIDNQIVHKNETVNLVASTKDEYNNFVVANLTWRTVHSDIIATGNGVDWTVPADYPIGNDLLKVTMEKTYYDTYNYSIVIRVWGNAEPKIVSPSSGTYEHGTTLPIECHVVDTLTDEIISNYNIKLYVDGSLKNESKGVVKYSWQAIGLNVHNISCEIEDNETLMYNATPSYANLSVNIVDTTPPDITNVSTKPSPAVVGQDVNITFTATDGVQVYSAWVDTNYGTETALSCGIDCYYVTLHNVEYGVVNYVIHANDTSGNERTKSGSFNVVYGAALLPSLTSKSVDNITYDGSTSFVIDLVLNNTGSENLTNANISISYNSTVIQLNESEIDCGNVSTGENCTRSILVTVNANAPPKTYWITYNSQWTRPDSSLANCSNITEITVEPNPVIYTTQSISSTIAHNTTSTVGAITIQSKGNYKLENLVVNVTGEIADWLECSNSIPTLEPGQSTQINVNATVPLGQDPGSYSAYIVFNQTDKSNQTLVTVNVPEDKTWLLSDGVIDTNIAANATGQAGEITIENVGNTEITLSITKTGNLSQYLDLPNQITVSKQNSTRLIINYADVPNEGYYKATLCFENPSANPTSNCTTINAQAYKFNISIEDPTTDSPVTVNASQLIVVNVSAMFGNELLTENLSLSAYVNGVDCTQSVSGNWLVNCIAPNLPDGQYYNLTVEANYTTYNIQVQSIQPNAVHYQDITPPSVNTVVTLDTPPTNPAPLEVKAQDNTNISEIKAEIVLPNNTVVNITLTKHDETTWKDNFTMTDLPGIYRVKYYIKDSENNIVVKEDALIVNNFTSIQANITPSKGEPANLTIEMYPTGTNILKYSITAQSGFYNATVPECNYDVALKVENITVILQNMTINSTYTEPVKLDQLSSTYVNPQGVKNKFGGVALQTNAPFSNATIQFNYQQYIPYIYLEQDLQAYKCENWSYDERTCNGTWTPVTTMIDTVNHIVVVPVSSFSAYAFAESPKCGDGLCDVIYGESCSTCPADCGECQQSAGGVNYVTYNYITQVQETPQTNESEENETNESVPITVQGSVNVATHSIVMELYQGEITETKISLKNTLNKSVTVEPSLEGELSDIIYIVNKSVRLGAGKDAQIKIRIAIPPDIPPRIYYGSIVLKVGDESAEIPVNIRVLQATRELLDIRVSPLIDQVKPGEPVRVRVDLYNLGATRRVDTTITLQLLNPNDLEKIDEISDTLAVETSINVIRNLKTPKDLKEGRYIVKGIATYTNANNTMEATAISYVSIEIPLLEREYYGHPLWMYLILAVVLLITATTTGYVYKKKKEEEERRRRYKALLQLKNLPKASPKNAFIGKVAETGIRAFIRLNDLMTHALIAGATGAGKTIAAQVIAEEALLHNKNVVVFDPTGQWTGFLRACKNRAMLKKYPLFGMKEKDARGFEGSIKLVESPDMKINIKELLEPKKARITVFVLDRLSPEQIDKFVANTVKQVFNQRPEEQKELKLLMVYDEVHRLLPKFGGSGEGFLQIERAVREFRKWGIGLILISQVLSDFVGEIRANIGMEIQTRTRYEKDLERIARKYGEEIAKSVVKASVGTGMLVFSEYNKGRPYFIEFRPILHQVKRLSDEELDKYTLYDKRITKIRRKIKEMEKKGVDTFNLKIELELAESKLAKGQFDMVETFLNELEPKLNTKKRRRTK